MGFAKTQFTSRSVIHDLLLAKSNRGLPFRHDNNSNNVGKPKVDTGGKRSGAPFRGL